MDSSSLKIIRAVSSANIYFHSIIFQRKSKDKMSFSSNIIFMQRHSVNMQQPGKRLFILWLLAKKQRGGRIVMHTNSLGAAIRSDILKKPEK